MSLSTWLTGAALALLPFAAAAQPARPSPDPADANALVLAADYVSALGTYRAATEEKAPPDQFWRAANEEVRESGGHHGHAMEPEADTHAGHAAQNSKGK